MVFLMTLTDTSEETVSSWTGFNMMTRDNVTAKKDIVSYLTTINAPARNIFTVYEVLNNMLKIKNVLNVDKIVCI